MTLIRPRLNDYYNIALCQDDVDFAIPILDEDLPLYVDPFLLWKSPSLQDNSLHTAITNSFNYLGYLFNKGDDTEAVKLLIQSSECHEVGLGDSKTRQGKPIGKKLAIQVLSLFQDIPQINKSGFVHFEEIQLLVDNIAKDRVSDLACNFAKSFLIDFTQQQCDQFGIPMEKHRIDVYDYRRHKYVQEEVLLPTNPSNQKSLVFTPKRWLRVMPWLNFEDYYKGYFTRNEELPFDRTSTRNTVLNYNRLNYDVIQSYTRLKEQRSHECKNDPLFQPIPVLSAKRKLKSILNLPTGKLNNADKKYEDLVGQLMASLVYPELDFADAQSRTDSGVLIRDLIFYNNRSYGFLQEIYQDFDCRQIVMELKNVAAIEPTHIHQLNRYLSPQFGRFGILITRHPPAKKILKNTIDLWSGQRKCILILHDSDLELMTQVYESKQRRPIDILKKKYLEFIRACPS